ncbi:hypothetical protein GGQ80_001583 [Sphingomonas jinjuensis]|uniref:Uncharacterized protein n=1 Tax=Sphingomonas jinjuensis TaxID=535907 RepID=A0A840FDN0_9SPHN|nr:hypothetical protein [Sphingomonas jinjuensis]MBB4153677.1 hypothetical protein [Sphingomonas jinjuensis]
MTFRTTYWLAGIALAIAAPASAQSVFDGTWKGEATSATLDVKPDEFTLKDGLYSCKSCIPPYAVKADGQFHAVKDRPYWDEIALTVVDPNVVRMQFRKNGKIVAENVETVSADGNTITFKGRNTNNGAGTVVEQSSSATRVGASIPGAHRISGAWKPDPKTNQVSDNAMTMMVKVHDGMVHMTTGLGETLNAKIGGDYALTEKDPGKTMSKVEMPAPNVMKITDMRQGKVVQVSTYTVTPDGRTLDGAWMDPRDGSKGTFVARKQ